MKTREERLYVGAMNDALLIIDQPPRPSNDHINPDVDVKVIAKICDPGPEGDRYAAMFAAAPELLAMLQRIRAAELCSYLNSSLDALIAKATGQEVGR